MDYVYSTEACWSENNYTSFTKKKEKGKKKSLKLDDERNFTVAFFVWTNIKYGFFEEISVNEEVGVIVGMKAT